MDKLVFSDWLSMITAFGVLVALVSNVMNIRSRRTDEAAAISEMRTDIKNIKSSVARIENLTERLTAMEQSTKSAHKRINRLEGGGGGTGTGRNGERYSM